MAITVERMLAPGLFSVSTTSIRGEEGRAMWSLKKLRKDSPCAATGKQLRKGELHYAPIGNMDYRGWRVHRDYMEGEII